METKFNQLFNQLKAEHQSKSDEEILELYQKELRQAADTDEEAEG